MNLKRTSFPSLQDENDRQHNLIQPMLTNMDLNGPADPIHRILSLDILRGFALLGILLLNIYEFASPTLAFDVPLGLSKPAFTGWHKSLDNGILWLTWLFAEGKMRSLFSLLFGAGVIMITERYEKSGKTGQAAGIFYRRNFWLLLIGLCHGFLLFPGDILVDYSVLAMLVLFFLRRFTARTLLISGIVVWIFFGTIGIFNAVGVNETLRADKELKTAIHAGTHRTPAQQVLISTADKSTKDAVSGLQQQVQAGHLSYWESRLDRVNNEIGLLIFKSSGLFVSYLGAMIFGMGLYKSGFLTNQRPVKEYFLLMFAGYAVTLIITGIGLWQLQQSGYSSAIYTQRIWIPYCLQVAAGTLGNLSLLLLLLRTRLFISVLSPLAAVGRTALSNYILTSLICGWLFSWGPFKLYGALEYYQWYCVVAGVWAVNIISSILWLKYFRFGPVEWLWRSLTYWKMQPLRNGSTRISS